jgi:predicted site-specific integrase-resolvase
MKEKEETEFISTEEAAKMLGIARSTVGRYFDKGILTGRQNSTRKWRSISKNSVLALMKKHGMRWEE